MASFEFGGLLYPFLFIGDQIFRHNYANTLATSTKERSHLLILLKDLDIDQKACLKNAFNQSIFGLRVPVSLEDNSGS